MKPIRGKITVLVFRKGEARLEHPLASEEDEKEIISLFEKIGWTLEEKRRC